MLVPRAVPGGNVIRTAGEMVQERVFLEARIATVKTHAVATTALHLVAGFAAMDLRVATRTGHAQIVCKHSVLNETGDVGFRDFIVSEHATLTDCDKISGNPQYNELWFQLIRCGWPSCEYSRITNFFFDPFRRY